MKKVYSPDYIYLTGSGYHIKRAIYEEDGKNYVFFYGNYIEVVRCWSSYGYKTALDY